MDNTASPRPQYKVMIHYNSYQRLQRYLSSLKSGGAKPGLYLMQQLQGRYDMTVPEFLEKLVQTKKPIIFAESSVYGNGNDWNEEELQLLGDVSVATPVTIFDNGRHSAPDVHAEPFAGTLLFVLGALLSREGLAD